MENQCDQCSGVCTAVATQCADVSLPLSIKPRARVKDIKTTCSGEPVVCMKSGCGQACTSVCELVITQGICVTVTMEYNAAVEAGDPCVICRRPCNCP